MGTQWRVTVDRGVCRGAAMCTNVAPQRFALDDESRSNPVAELVPADDPAVLDAVELCPHEAISVTDPESGEPVAV